MKKTALLTGVSGQIGSYLAEYLLRHNYKVFGMIRRHSDSAAQQTPRIQHIINDLTLEYADVTDATSVERVVRLTQPDEVYHLAGQSQVRISFIMPKFTTDVNVIGTINVLEAVRSASPYCKFFQASSSDMFGHTTDDDGIQRETTPMQPVSPHGCGKLFCYHLVKNYRSAYHMFAVNGILFNNTSIRQGANFVTTKIIKAAKAIKRGEQTELVLGNLDSARDWSHAKDIVRAMYLMMNHKEPDDFLVASGESHTVREMCQYIFERVGLKYEKFVRQDTKYTRPEDAQTLKGDATKARNVLGWKPKYDFYGMLDEMVKEIE